MTKKQALIISISG